MVGAGVRRRILDVGVNDTALGAGLDCAGGFRDRQCGWAVGCVVAPDRGRGSSRPRCGTDRGVDHRDSVDVSLGRVVWSRTIVQIAAEEERRRIVAQQQSKTLLDSLQTNTDNADSLDNPDSPDAGTPPDSEDGR